MRIASIDCGTNTIVLLIAEVNDNLEVPIITKIEDQVQYARLGQGLAQTGFLQEAAIERTLQALKRFQQRAKEQGANPIFFFATEAVRQAKNGQAFLQRAQSQGIPLRILSGDEEATYAFEAVAAAIPTSKSSFLTVVDSGGGSTQVLVGQDKQVHQKKSIPLGMVTLTEQFLHHDPPSPAEKEQIQNQIQTYIQTLPSFQGQVIGISGTLFALGSLLFSSSSQPGPFHPEELHGKTLTRFQIETVTHQLGELSLEQRKLLPGMEQNRADVIYAGALIWLMLLKHNQVEQITLCNRNVRFGVLTNWVLSQKR